MKIDEIGDWLEVFCDVMVEGGWFGIVFLEEYGGVGFGFIEVVLMM